MSGQDLTYLTGKFIAGSEKSGEGKGKLVPRTTFSLRVNRLTLVRLLLEERFSFSYRVFWVSEARYTVYLGVVSDPVE